MLTKWGKYCASMIKDTSGSAVPSQASILPKLILSVSSAPGLIAAKTIANNDYYISPVPYNIAHYIISNMSETSSYGIAFGSSNTPATENDYMLGSFIPNLTGNASEQTIADLATLTYKAQIQLTISNNTGSPVEINEVGLFGLFNTTTTRGANVSNTRRCIMIDRTVLENPVTIANGDSGLVQYDFIYPAGEVTP